MCKLSHVIIIILSDVQQGGSNGDQPHSAVRSLQEVVQLSADGGTQDAVQVARFAGARAR